MVAWDFCLPNQPPLYQLVQCVTEITLVDLEERFDLSRRGISIVIDFIHHADFCERILALQNVSVNNADHVRVKPVEGPYFPDPGGVSHMDPA